MVKYGPAYDAKFRDPALGVIGGKYGLTKIDSVTLGLPSPFTTLKLDSGLKIGSNEHEIYEDGTGMLWINVPSSKRIKLAIAGSPKLELLSSLIRANQDISMRSGVGTRYYRPDNSAYGYIVNEDGSIKAYAENSVTAWRIAPTCLLYTSPSPRD